jgi:NCS1 family nucleobase:cation symporter-1
MSQLVEQRTIDIIPADERHGRARDLFTIWFGSNILPLTVYTGALAVSAFGLGFWASVIAVLLGNLGGAVFMALHSIQGPKLGVPQMIQSRGQFGAVGAVLLVGVTVVMYLGFFASNLFFGGETINALTTSVSVNQGQVITAIAGFAVVVFGYSLIHTLNKIATVVLGIAMVVSIVIIATNLPSDFFTKGSFHWAGFISTVSFAALWQLAYAPYVSDYSRYMPADERLAQTFWASYWGSCLGSIIPMIWGIMAALAYTGNGGLDAVVAIKPLSSPIGSLIMLLLFVSAAQSNAINLYGGALCLITVIQTFVTSFVPRAFMRILIGAVFVAVSVYLALSISDFLASYVSFLSLLLYLLVPWTAINLTDYYIVRKGHYDVEAFFLADGGIYGRFNMTALGAYAIGVIAELPFMILGTPDYTGFAVSHLGGADISWIVGLVVTIPVYLVLARATVPKAQQPAEGLA